MSYWLERYHQQSGQRIGIIENFAKLHFIRTENTIGALEVELPLLYYNPDEWWKNQVLEVWKQDGFGQSLQGETAYFLRNWQLYRNDNYEQMIRLYAADANFLLASRIVAYAAGSAQADKTDEADDMMKAIVRENLGTLADATRQIAALTCEADLSLLPSTTKSFSRQNVFNVIRDISDATKETGTYNVFDVIRTTPCNFEFRVYKDRRGIDHSRDSSDPRFVGEKYGNLSKPSLEYRGSEEITFVYAGGQGEEADRIIKTAQDDSRIGDGYPFNRREYFRDARNCETDAAVQAEADAALAEGRPKRILTGDLIDMPSMKYGVHFGFGDLLTAEAFGVSMDVHVTSVDITAGPDGEKIKISLRGEDAG